MTFLLRLIIPFLVLNFISGYVYSQDENNELIQFSGIIVTSDSIKPVPFTHIIIRNEMRGTTSDFLGFFSFVARKNDTIEFSAMGFKNEVYVVPDSITSNRYSLIQVLASDTIMLAETIIYPWPTKEQFREAFLTLDVPDDDLERARKNLELMEIKERAANMPMSADMNYRNYIDKQTSKLYYAGQLPPNNLLNPFAWAKFVEAWRAGKLKLEK